MDEMDFVMDKDGNQVTSFVYDDWNEYVVSWMLSYPDNDYCILSDDYKKTECKYENFYNILRTVSENITPEERTRVEKELENIVTDDTYYIWITFIYCYRSSGARMKPDEEKLTKSVSILTQGFENNPIKAYIRWNHYGFHDLLYNEVLQELLNVYWIYYFSESICNNIFTLYDDTIRRVNIEKALNYIENTHDQRDEILDAHKKLCVVAARKDVLSAKKIADLEDEIEELLSPNGAGYKVVKERFEKMQNNAELN